MNNPLSTVMSKLSSIEGNANTQADVLEISVTGSSLFKQGAKDVDVLAVVRNFAPGHRSFSHLEDGVRHDIFVVDSAKLERIMRFQEDHPMKSFNVSYYIRQRLHGSFELDWSISDHREQQFALIARYIRGNVLKDNVPSPQVKLLWWHYLTLKFIEKNDYVVTASDKEKLSRWSSNSITAEDRAYWASVYNSISQA